MPERSGAALLPVILCGGEGKRLAPRSTPEQPKPFLPLPDGTTLFQRALLRATALPGAGAQLIVCNEVHGGLVEKQLRGCGVETGGTLLEPMGRNTGPAATLAALCARETGDPVLVLLPADQLLDDEPLARAVTTALPVAEGGTLVALGIPARSPETRFGYALAGSPLSGHPEALTVNRFTEKPDEARAQEYIATGSAFWNGGIYLFRASMLLEEARTYAPEILAACEAAMDHASREADRIRPDADAFSNCPALSIEHAITEKSAKVALVPLEGDWRDVGVLQEWEQLTSEGETR